MPRPAALVAALLVPLAGCGLAGPGGDDSSGRAPVVTGTDTGTETVALGGGYGLNLPRALAGFTREDTALGHGAPGAVAGYAHPDAPGPIMATIHAGRVPGGTALLGDGGPNATAARSDAALDASLREIRRFYPDAVAGARSDVFIVRFGAVQHGRSTTVRFTDLLAGERQPIAMRVETYCCLDGHWDYEYRFRAPADLSAPTLEHAFANAIPWSREPAGSVEPAE